MKIFSSSSRQIPVAPAERRRSALRGAMALLALGFGGNSVIHAAPAPAATPATSASATTAPGKPATSAKPAATGAKGAAPTFETTKIERPTFTLTYPSAWTEDKAAATYDANSNFTLVSPKNSYVQFSIIGQTDSPAKIVADNVKKLDGPTITSLSKTKLDEWGNHKGTGYHLKGKIFGSYPGGIKVFVFSFGRHNVLVTEFYFSDELKDVLGDFEYISRNFTMKN